MDERVIYLHGFSQDEAIVIMRAVKAAAQDAGGIAFAMATPTNVEWKIRDMVSEVREEHEYMKKNPPVR